MYMYTCTINGGDLSAVDLVYHGFQVQLKCGQLLQDTGSMMVLCWDSVEDDGPT